MGRALFEYGEIPRIPPELCRLVGHHSRGASGGRHVDMPAKLERVWQAFNGRRGVPVVIAKISERTDGCSPLLRLDVDCTEDV